MVTRIDWHRVATTALGIIAGTVASLGTVAVAVAGFTLSFDAIRAVAVAAHVRPSWAWLMPLSVDGAMSVATVAAVVLRRLGRRPAYPWLVVLSGAAISIACNALHARGGQPIAERAAMAVSAIPPVMLALSVHLLVALAVAVADRQPAAEPATTNAPPAPAPVAMVSVGTDKATDTTVSGDTEPTLWRPVAPLAAVPPLPDTDTAAASPRAVERRSAAPTCTTADIVAELHRRYPDATAKDIAGMAGRSVRTVERHLPAARRAGAADTDTAERINGVAVAASN